LSRKYHPDKNPDEDTTDKFMKIKKAFETLNDPERRVFYDVYGTEDFG
jgi:molecular chaperone DnaJ